MNWHYAAKKFSREHEDGHIETWYGLVEVYPSLNAHTEKEVKIIGETPSDLAKWLRKAANDIENYEVEI